MLSAYVHAGYAKFSKQTVHKGAQMLGLAAAFGFQMAQNPLG